MAKDFVCKKCKKSNDGFVAPSIELWDGVERVNGFCYLGDRLNASGGCGSAVKQERDLVGLNSENVENCVVGGFP